MFKISNVSLNNKPTKEKNIVKLFKDYITLNNLDKYVYIKIRRNKKIIPALVYFDVNYLYIKFNLYKDMTKLYKEKNQLFPLLAATNAMIIIQGIVDCTLYAPQLGIMFVCMGAITYNIANDKMVRKRKLIKNKDIAV